MFDQFYDHHQQQQQPGTAAEAATAATFTTSKRNDKKHGRKIASSAAADEKNEAKKTNKKVSGSVRGGKGQTAAAADESTDELGELLMSFSNSSKSNNKNGRRMKKDDVGNKNNNKNKDDDNGENRGEEEADELETGPEEADDTDDDEYLDLMDWCRLQRRRLRTCWTSLRRHPASILCAMLIFGSILIFLFITYMAINAASSSSSASETAGLSSSAESDSDQQATRNHYNASRGHSLVDALCQAWHRGDYAGDFCPVLCAPVLERNWTLVDFIEGGSKRVLKMRYEGKEMVLKMQHALMEDYDQQLDFRAISEDEFMDKVLDIVNDHLRLEWPRRYKWHLLHKLWPPYRKGQPLGQAAMRSIWALIQQDEFINQAVLEMSRVTPKLLGVCGHAYRSEYLIPFRMKSYYLNLKAKILVHLMGTLKLFYEFLNDPLQWCDVKFDNLGLSADYPKRFVMMDSDMMYTESKLNVMLTGQHCRNDTECGFFDCHSKCNQTSGFCLPRTNDNIDVFCQKLVTQLFGAFWSKSNKYLAACHQDPVNVTQRLNELRLVWSWTLSDV